MKSDKFKSSPEILMFILWLLVLLVLAVLIVCSKYYFHPGQLYLVYANSTDMTKYEKGVIYFCSLIDDSEKRERLYALMSLDKFSNNQNRNADLIYRNLTTPVLLKCIYDTNNGIRLRAIVMLSEIHPDPELVIPVYLGLLNDNIGLIVEYAIDGLVSYPNKFNEYLKEIAVLTKHDDPEVRWTAIRGLTKLGRLAENCLPELEWNAKFDDDFNNKRVAREGIEIIKKDIAESNEKQNESHGK